jgi:hypothetical protein
VPETKRLHQANNAKRNKYTATNVGVALISIMSLISVILLGLFILFCIGMILGSLANGDETISKRLGCAAPFALFIILTVALGSMDNKREMRELLKFFAGATFVNIVLGTVFRSWDGDDGRPLSFSRGTWRGTIGNVFLFLAVVCTVSCMVLGVALNEAPPGPPEPPEPIVLNRADFDR